MSAAVYIPPKTDQAGTFPRVLRVVLCNIYFLLRKYDISALCHHLIIAFYFCVCMCIVPCCIFVGF